MCQEVRIGIEQGIVDKKSMSIVPLLLEIAHQRLLLLQRADLKLQLQVVDNPHSQRMCRSHPHKINQ
jgi:hypothetical protein